MDARIAGVYVSGSIDSVQFCSCLVFEVIFIFSFFLLVLLFS